MRYILKTYWGGVVEALKILVPVGLATAAFIGCIQLAVFLGEEFSPVAGGAVLVAVVVLILGAAFAHASHSDNKSESRHWRDDDEQF